MVVRLRIDIVTDGECSRMFRKKPLLFKPPRRVLINFVL